MASYQNCVLCISGSKASKIIGYCKDCKGYVCNKCYQTQTKAKAFRHHAIDKGTTAKQTADKEMASLENSDIHEQICKQHSNEKTYLFCRTHMVVICGQCLMQTHMNCEKQLVDLTEVSHPSIDHLNQIKHELEEILSDAQCLEQKVSVRKENNNSAKDENFKSVRDFRKDIDKYFNRLQNDVENKITQYYVKNESILSSQLKTCLEVKDTALLKQKQIDSIIQKNLKSTLYVTTDIFGTEIATLKQTLKEASRKPIGPLYEFQKNDVVRNLILTENVFGKIEGVHTGSDEVTQTITREQEHLQLRGITTQSSSEKSVPPSCENNESIKTAEVELHQAKYPWKLRRLKFSYTKKVMEEKDHEMETRGILNKLTPQNFRVLVSQMQALSINTESKLNRVIDLVFEKAISELHFSVVYANMIERDIGDSLKESCYMCVERDTSNKCPTMLVDMSIINKQVRVRSDLTLIGTTYDTREKWTKERLYVQWMYPSLTTGAITDITFLRKGISEPPKGYTIVGDLNNLTLCYKVSKIRS